MNPNLSPRICKGLIVLTGAFIAYQSALLTHSFMNSLSPALGVIGLLMELVKFFVPILALYAYRKGAIIRTGMLISITLLLVAMSFTASFVSVNTGFQDQRTETAQFAVLSEQINMTRLHGAELRNQAGSLPDNYITKRALILEQAKQSDLALIALLNQRAILKTDSIADQYGKSIALATAFIIELLTVSVSVALSLFKTKEQSRTIEGKAAVKPLTASVTARVEKIQPEQKELVFHAKTNVSEQIRNAILTRSIERPSVSCIRKTFSGIANSKISGILKELAALGHLEPKGARGWRYA